MPSPAAKPLDLSPLRELLDRIEAHYHPEEVWLFGSRARGDARPDSDWDLLVVVPDEAGESALNPLDAWRLQKGSGVYADVIPCLASEFRDSLDTVNTIAYIVAREGVRIDEHRHADREHAPHRARGSRRSARAGAQR